MMITPRRRRHRFISSLLLLLLIILQLSSSSTVVLATTSNNRQLQNDDEEYTEPSYACSRTNCPTDTHQCIANPNHGQKSTDEHCLACQKGQTYWPCDVDGLCYCWDKSTSKIPPAPSTKLPINTALDPCDDIFTEQVFTMLAPEAQHPYSYRGFCQAVRDYNANHPSEGIFIMGTEMQQRHELAAFMGNVLHESDELKAGREYLMCADQKFVGGEMYCKPCDMGGFDWETFTCPGSSLASEGRAFNGYCQSNLLPPDGCECDDVYEVSSSGEMAGYVKADQVYFGRGAIQLSWNYNYIKASVALTGHSQTFCQRPDMVATKEEYAWGAGLFYWMENVKNDKTCHQAVLMHNEFGQTLDIINGGLECPADDHGWHGKAVQLRLNRYCRAATALGLDTLLSFSGCMDMEKKFVQCLKEGNCDACKVWEDKVALPDINTILTVEEGGGAGGGPPTRKPTKRDNTKRPTKRPTLRPVAPPPTIEPTHEISGPCSGEPCPVPPGIEEEFCRSADGICGMGPPYCNAHSTWTSFCFNCETDSPFGCPTFGCNDCPGETQQCVGNKNGINPIRDGECEPCGQGQTFYPCDVEGSKGCWCWDTRLPRVEPSPPSGLEMAESSTSSSSIGEGVCGELIDKALFRLLAPNAQHPFTYEGFCSAIDHYNSRHAEKVFRMGTRQQRIDELTAFLGMASHETDGFTAAREYLACGDNALVNGELYCTPCTSENYNFDTHTCSVSMLENDQSYMNFCQPYTVPPNGCSCEYVKEVEASGQLEGHMKANDIFFGRGSIQISNNFNYIRASATMTGSIDTFCKEPELLSTVESYSWGVGIFIWVEFMKEEGKTSHTHALNGNFGSALNIINGSNECPVKEDEEWYSTAVRRRLDHYCSVAKVMGAINLLSFDGCDGLGSVFRQCLADGSCPNCAYYDPRVIRTAPPTDSSGAPPKIATSPPSPMKPNMPPPPSVSVSKTSPPSSPKTSPPTSSSTNVAPLPSPTGTVSTNAPTNSSDSRTRRPTHKPIQPLPIPTYHPSSPEGTSHEEVGSMTNWAMTSLNYPPTNAPTSKPTSSSTSKPVALVTAPKPTTQVDPAKGTESNNFEMEPTEIVPASEVVNQQNNEQAVISLMTKVDDTTFIFKPIGDTTISRTHPDTNYGSKPSMVVNMIDGDVALISFDVSDLLDSKVEKAVLRLAILDENALNAGIFYVQPTMNEWTENTVTYNSAPAANGSLFSSSIDRTDSTHFELDVTNAVGNNSLSLRIIGTNKLGSEFGSKESSNKSNSPELVVTITPEQQGFTSSRPINDSVGGKENPHDLSQLYQGKPSIVQSSGKPADSSPGMISGHIWLDKNYDGVKEADEPGLRGVLVDLYSCDDRWVEGMRTSSGGDYIFDDLPEGKYYAVATAGADYGFTPKNVGPDNSKDSDVDATTGRSDCIDLSSPLQLSASVNVGMVMLSELSSAYTNSDNVEADEAGTESYNCRGKPCTEGEGYCRSEHNYCGSGETYCNERSQWTPECPSESPTLKPTGKPTTGQPSFAHNQDINCSGEPCTEGDGTWCRSEIGFCGGGKFYCNSDSIWLPKCGGAISTGNTQTLVEVLDSFNSKAENTSIKPTKAPTEMAAFSTFALPTLSHISNPNQVDTTMLGNMYGIETVHYDFQSDTPKSEGQNVFTIHDNGDGGGIQNNQDEAWYARFVDESRRNSGIERPRRGHLCSLIQDFILLVLI